MITRDDDGPARDGDAIATGETMPATAAPADAETVPGAGAATGPGAAARPALDAPERYTLGERLGEGAMGVVWAAHDRALDRKVALKVLHDQYLGAADQARIAEEARAMARLSHPNVVAVYDTGERDGRRFLTMELVDGAPLSSWLETPRSWQEIVEVFRAVGEGLAAAHAAGVIHRDVKPGNVLVGNDRRVRVADFGIARAEADVVAAGARATPATAGIVGSPAYMAPERLRGEPADARSDQYAFFVSLHEALHGVRPYEGGTVRELLAAIGRGAPARRRDVPRWLDDAVRRGLAADPAARYPSMVAAVAALRGPRRGRRAFALGAAAAVVAGGALAIALGGRADRAPAAAACGDASRHLAGAWDADARARVAAAFDATGVGYAATTAREVERTLDRYARDWVAMHEASCVATHVDRTQTPELHARRVQCLDERRAGLAHVAAALAAVDARGVASAAATVRALDPVRDCADPRALAAGGDDGAAAAPAEGRARVVVARTHLYTGRHADGIAIADAIVGDARRAGDLELEVEALVVRGRLEQAAGQHGPAAETLRGAAERGGDAVPPRLRAEAWAFLSTTLQTMGRLDEAEQVLALADAALRDDPDPARETHVLNARGTLLGRRGRYAEAAPQFERMLVIAAELYGEDSFATAPALTNLTTALRRLGRGDEALATAQRAVAVTAALGPDAPLHVAARRGVAAVLGGLGRHGEALAISEEVLASRQRAGASLPELADAHRDVATALSLLARHDEAVAAFAEAARLHAEAAPDGPQALSARAAHADALTRVGRAAEALPIVEEVLAAREQRLGKVHPDVALGHEQRALALRLVGRADDAVRSYDQAIATYVALHGERHPSVVMAILAQAEVERERGRYRRALALARRAQELGDAVYPADHPGRARVLVILAAAHLGLRQLAPARAAAVEAERLVAGADDPVALAGARFVLAQLAWEDGERERSLALAREARALVGAGADGTLARLVSQIDAWLAARA